MRGPAGKELQKAGLMNHLYRAIKPGPSMPGAPNVPGKTTAQQAQALQYQDMYKNIQAMREAAFKREKARGEFVKEFQGLGGYLGKAAKKTAPGLLVAGALLGAYLLWNKKKTTEPVADETPPADVKALETKEARYYYY